MNEETAVFDYLETSEDWCHKFPKIKWIATTKRKILWTHVATGGLVYYIYDKEPLF